MNSSIETKIFYFCTLLCYKKKIVLTLEQTASSRTDRNKRYKLVK